MQIAEHRIVKVQADAQTFVTPNALAAVQIPFKDILCPFIGQRIIAAQSTTLAAPQLCGIAVAVDERRHFDDCAVVALGLGTQRETVVVAGSCCLIVGVHIGFHIHKGNLL